VDTNKKKILEALEFAKGIVTDACRATDIPRSTFYLWCNTDPEFKAAVDDIQEVAIDYVEGKLFQKIDGVTVKGKGGDENDSPVYELPPSDTAIIFYLKTKGKKRGYVERSEVDNRYPDGVRIKHVYQEGNDPLDE
jgi:hypothetical protein